MGPLAQPSCGPVDEIGDDDFVVAFHPRNRDVLAFVDRVRRAPPSPRPPPHGQPAVTAVPPVRPYPRGARARGFSVQPRIEALAVASGELVCNNDDLIRNAASAGRR